MRDLGNWERKGPLSPVPQPERSESRDGSRAPRPLEAGRSDSYRGARRASPAAWGGSGEAGDGSRPPRREFVERPERPERVPTAADKDMQWRTSMRPDLANKSPVQSREGSEAPPSPAGGAPAQPAGRPKLNLAKRTVSEAPAIVSPALSVSDSKANPFGAARPIDTAAREKLIEEKRVQALKEKKEADDKAKEERRLAKEAAAKEAADKAEADAAAKAEAEAAEAAEAAKPKAEPKAEAKVEPKAEAEAADETVAAADASGDQKLPVRAREPKEPRGENVANLKSRATDSGNWRNASAGDRGAPRGAPASGGPRRGGAAGRGGAMGGRSESGRGPRANGTGPTQAAPQSPVVDQAPTTPKPDDDGWTTVAPVSKGRRGGR